MRLVLSESDVPIPERPVPSVRIHITDPNSGRLLAHFDLRLCVENGSFAHMLHVASPLQRDTSPPPDAVAGKIEASRAPVLDALDGWIDHLRALRRKPATLKAYRSDTARVIRECGMSRVEDVTYPALSGWLAGLRNVKGTTYNRYLMMLRSFTRYLAEQKLLSEDPLAGAARAADDGGDGSRAGTTEEARKLLMRAWARDQADRRCSGNRAAYDAMLFLAACRLDEPARLKRRHVKLSMHPPRIVWTPDVHKSGKTIEQVICGELACVLRDHIAAIDAQRIAEKQEPLGPDDPLFPVVPSPATFRQDRKAAAIDAEDYRGRPFTPHSARKWFATALTGAGVSHKMVDHLMRHKGSVEQRYFDPSAEEMWAAVQKLPTIWPKPLTWREIDCGKLESSEKAVDNRPEISEDGIASRLPETAHNSTSATGIVTPRPDSQLDEAPLPVADFEALGSPHKGGRKARRIASEPVINPRMPISGLITGTDANDLADFFESLAKVIRNGAGHGFGEQFGVGPGGAGRAG